jgi:hypothetical protein
MLRIGGAIGAVEDDVKSWVGERGEAEKKRESAKQHSSEEANAPDPNEAGRESREEEREGGDRRRIVSVVENESGRVRTGAVQWRDDELGQRKVRRAESGYDGAKARKRREEMRPMALNSRAARPFEEAV